MVVYVERSISNFWDYWFPFLQVLIKFSSASPSSTRTSFFLSFFLTVWALIQSKAFVIQPRCLVSAHGTHTWTSQFAERISQVGCACSGVFIVEYVGQSISSPNSSCRDEIINFFPFNICHWVRLKEKKTHRSCCIKQSFIFTSPHLLT